MEKKSHFIRLFPLYLTIKNLKFIFNSDLNVDCTSFEKQWTTIVANEYALK